MGRALIIGISIFLVFFGLVAVVSAFARGLGVTNGVLLGLVLIAVGSYRLVVEARRGSAT